MVRVMTATPAGGVAMGKLIAGKGAEAWPGWRR